MRPRKSACEKTNSDVQADEPAFHAVTLTKIGDAKLRSGDAAGAPFSTPLLFAARTILKRLIPVKVIRIMIC